MVQSPIEANKGFSLASHFSEPVQQVEAGKLGHRDLERALSAQQEMGSLIGHVLVSLGLVSDIEVVFGQENVNKQLRIKAPKKLPPVFDSP